MRRKATKRLSTSLKLGPCRHRPDIVGFSGWFWAGRLDGWWDQPKERYVEKEVGIMENHWFTHGFYRHFILRFFFGIWFWVNFSSKKESYVNIQFQLNMGPDRFPISMTTQHRSTACHLRGVWTSTVTFPKGGKKKPARKKLLEPVPLPSRWQVLLRDPLYTPWKFTIDIKNGHI